MSKVIKSWILGNLSLTMRAIMGETGLKILVDLDSPHWDKIKDFKVVNVKGIHKKMHKPTKWLPIKCPQFLSYPYESWKNDLLMSTYFARIFVWLNLNCVFFTCRQIFALWIFFECTPSEPILDCKFYK